VPPELPARPFAESSELVECVVASDELIDSPVSAGAKTDLDGPGRVDLERRTRETSRGIPGAIGAAWLIGTAAGECWAVYRAVLARTPRRTAVHLGLVPAPKIALLPLLILWFGIGVASKVAIIARCKRIASARIAGGR